ncbi:unnamed protein product [Prunus brigantina]
MGVDDFFNPHGSLTDADFGPESDPESRSYFDYSKLDPKLGSYFDDPDYDDNDDPDPLFHCTDYDFSTNDLDTWTRLRILW